MTSKKYIQHRLKILKKAIICLTVIVIVCIIALACYIFYAAYILGKTPAPHYEEMDYAPEYELDDINPRVSNGPQKHIKKRNFDYSIAITDKFIYAVKFGIQNKDFNILLKNLSDGKVTEDLILNPSNKVSKFSLIDNKIFITI